jgi:hypothetical protein
MAAGPFERSERWRLPVLRLRQAIAHNEAQRNDPFPRHRFFQPRSVRRGTRSAAGRA